MTLKVQPIPKSTILGRFSDGTMLCHKAKDDNNGNIKNEVLKMERNNLRTIYLFIQN